MPIGRATRLWSNVTLLLARLNYISRTVSSEPSESDGTLTLTFRGPRFPVSQFVGSVNAKRKLGCDPPKKGDLWLPFQGKEVND